MEKHEVFKKFAEFVEIVKPLPLSVEGSYIFTEIEIKALIKGRNNRIGALPILSNGKLEIALIGYEDNGANDPFNGGGGPPGPPITVKPTG